MLLVIVPAILPFWGKAWMLIEISNKKVMERIISLNKGKRVLFKKLWIYRGKYKLCLWAFVVCVFVVCVFSRGGAETQRGGVWCVFASR